MLAVVITRAGGPEVLELRDVPDATPDRGEVLIRVSAAGVNRADLGQRMGNHPPPPGASPYPGLECSGTIVELGAGVTEWSVGDEVAALLTAGGYAELVAVPAAQVVRRVPALSLVHNAGFPETTCTVHSMIFNAELSPRILRAGDVFLVHGGSSGIGTTAIQMAKAAGAEVAVTVGSDEKAQMCRDLGADLAINYRTHDFAEVVTRVLGGADVILDIMGASYLSRNLHSLRDNGRLAMIGQLGGSLGEIDLAMLQAKAASFHAAGLRARTAAQKAAIVQATDDFVRPLLTSGGMRPVIGQVLPLSEAATAHEIVAAGGHVGKILLVP